VSSEALDRALRIVLQLLGPSPIDPQVIPDNCELVLGMLASRGDDLPPRDELIRIVESKVVVWQPPATSLEDRTGHVEWLPARQEQVEWKFWNRFRRYLEEVALLPPAVIARLDEATDQVLSKLEDPTRGTPWDRRGLVAGQVQSGKTSHYIGLVCKAVDSGYPLIVVLAGVHNSLRSQTQLRLDEGFLGFDTQYQQRTEDNGSGSFGAGAILGADRLKAGSLTTSHQGGDFKRAVAQNIAIPVGQVPVLLVIKKHTAILKHLHTWLTEMHGEPTSVEPTERVIRDIPILIVDDEADYASVDTKPVDGANPSETNKWIRKLLKAFERSAYVGYTATPFANIFSATNEADDYGLDVFPRSFIENLRPPSNYFGPLRVFGLEQRGSLDLSPDVEEMGGLPIVRDVLDYQSWMPDKHTKHWIPPALPDSLREAVLGFFLTCAARRARGQASEHNSMLVHVTRFQDVQARVAEAINELLQNHKYRIRYGDGEAESIWDELKGLWLSDYEPTTAHWPLETQPLVWTDVRPHVEAAVAKIQVKTLNGSSNDALEYYEHRVHGLSVIAIGGDKLSRGLTLDGLSVSFYLRASRMYDTLMQMGRWFGYRPGYEDLCRLYTTPTLWDWYREITINSEELRQEFEHMRARGATPEEYGLQIRTSPAGLSVTAPNKMRRATTVRLTFSGEPAGTVTFDVRPQVLDQNRANLERFVTELRGRCGEPCGAPGRRADGPGGNYAWTAVPGQLVADEFFRGYASDGMARSARSELVARYIDDAVKVGELTDWTVVLVSNRDADATTDIAGLSVGLTRRRPVKSKHIGSGHRYTIKTVLSPPDELIDLSDEQRVAAFDMTCDDARDKAEVDAVPYVEPKVASGRAVRRQRHAENALLLLYVLKNVAGVAAPMVGFYASFPVSRKFISSEFKVNEIWSLLALDDLDDEDDT
jgi:hypothetical protein